ncbi:MAG TPA: universal stress protein [Acidobacteriaceae bacterium]|nr:universal stress protein [Acidobacteriaceae bacterium]
MFKKIAVAFDESPEAARAFHSALELAKLTGAELTVITVIERLPAYVSYVASVAPDVPQILQRERQTFYAELHHRARQAAQQAGVAVQVKSIDGGEIDGLLHLIDEVLPDLLVIGLRRDPGGLSGWIGGTAHRMALHAKCNILGIR